MIKKYKQLYKQPFSKKKLTELINNLKQTLNECENRIDNINSKKQEQLEITRNKPLKMMSRLVVEERGVAAFKYRELIQRITDYINQNALNHDFLISGDERLTQSNRKYYINAYEFNVPTELTKEITEVNNLTIKVIVTNYLYQFKLKNPYKYFDVKIGGTYNNQVDVIDDRLNSGLITINISAFNNQFNTHQTFTSLLHELQHLIEESNRVKNKRQTIADCGLSNQKVLEQLLDYKLPPQDENKPLSNILYFLFKNYELTANCTEVYSYLKSIHSTKENFKNDIAKTQSYRIFQRLRNDDIPLLETSENWVFWYLISLLMNVRDYNEGVAITLQFYKDFLKDFAIDMNAAKKCKDYILRKAKSRLNILQKQIGKVASLYYDDEEQKD